ncbi:hypothetical protein NG800_012365 [Epilithonimonas ginsengisoli]|uniref:Uncharacterized protein n=1 Tax=Epilithonimonas ginsengisoli TaxID=1245592 RepID=A0ABU4JJ53_9FLAO|nr:MULTISPECIES: hypothetical protein [Chryseobacterium group]MBV6880257.1 hypothetical protein [Epilithonimonas sp. FP105]MDW8549709.1 hypothetical protein [Epilithonimonas ginsengisoli]OAH72209.1 hypothetical protein AXA65_10690 [Chryseobacterium sp. FP211-J200]
MNEEFNELFDIKDDEKEISNLPVPKQNVLVHSIIRVVILIVATVLILGLLFVAAIDGEIGLAILALAIVIAWFGIMIAEAKNLRKKNKNNLADANNMIIVLAVVTVLSLFAYIATMQ